MWNKISLLLLIFCTASVYGTAAGITLNSSGLRFPLSSFDDYTSRLVTQLDSSDGLKHLALKGGKKPVPASSRVLKKQLETANLPNWEFSSVTLPIQLDTAVRNASLQFVAMRKNRLLRYSLLLRPVDGALRVWSSPKLYEKDKSAGPLKFNELNNMYFYIRSTKDTKMKFGDLQFNLRGKTELKAVPVLDAVFTEKVPAEKDWKNAPCRTLKTGLKAPAQIRFLHDLKNIYVRFDQKIDTSKLVSKQNSIGQIWRDDSFQVLISAGNDNKSYHQFLVNPAGAAQSYHFAFDQVADTFLRSRDIRPGEWSVKVKTQPDNWSAVFKINKTFLDKFQKESIHGVQLLVDNSASGNGFGFLHPTRRIFDLSNAGVLRLIARNKPLSKPFAAAPGLFFHKGSVLTGVPGKFSFRLSCPAGKVTGAGISGNNFAFVPKYTGTGGIQRLVIWNEKSGCIFAGSTQDIRFKQPFAYGTRVLIPEPKKTVWKKDKLAADPLTVFHRSDVEPVIIERLKNLWHGYFQTGLKFKKADLPKFTIVIGKTPEPVKLPAVRQSEGYALEINKKGITLGGKDAPGLNHAVTTLEQLSRYAMLRGEDFLPSVAISDYPDIPNRMESRWFDSNYWSPRREFRPYSDSFEEIEAEMYDAVYRFNMLSKMNILTLQNPNQIFYETKIAKELNRNTSHLTIQELKDYVAYCKKHHVEVIPAGAGASHANYLLTNNFPHLILPGYKRGDADPTHPDYWKYLNAARSEVINAIKPRYFNTQNDEWWHYPSGKVDVMQNGRPRHEIFRETIEKEHRFLKERGVKMMMYSDMLQPGHNGGKPYDNHVNLDKLPRDIIMLNWSGNEPGVKLFTKLGYTVWGVFNLSAMGKLDPEKIARDPKFQGIGCTTQPCYSPESGYGSHSLIATAETAWNFYTKSFTTMDDWLTENGAALLPMYSVLPNPRAAKTFKNVTIPGLKKLPAPFKAIPGGKQKVGFIPMAPVAGKGLKARKEPQIIPVNQKASSLIFLQSELISAKPPIAYPRRTRWILGIKSAIYTIRYADGKEIKVYSRHGINNGNAYPRRGRVASEIMNRYIHDARYVWQLSNKEKQFFVYQYEWINPRPEVAISSVAYSNLEHVLEGLDHYLFALTLRDVK